MFSSKRLVLRKVDKNDVELYHSWRNNMDVMYTTNPSLDLYSLEDTRSFVENNLTDSRSSKSYIILQKKKIKR